MDATDAKVLALAPDEQDHLRAALETLLALRGHLTLPETGLLRRVSCQLERNDALDFVVIARATDTPAELLAEVFNDRVQLRQENGDLRQSRERFREIALDTTLTEKTRVSLIVDEYHRLQIR